MYFMIYFTNIELLQYTLNVMKGSKWKSVWNLKVPFVYILWRRHKNTRSLVGKQDYIYIKYQNINDLVLFLHIFSIWQ